MKAINGKLDMSKSYRLVDIEYHGKLDIGTAESCENCGQLISNIAIVKDSLDRTYRIGLDCMATITNMPASDIQQAKNIVNRKRRFIKELSYAEKVEVRTNTFWFYTRTEYDALMVRGRGDWSLYGNYIKSLNIPIQALA
jgi:hypothetical protein